MSRWIITLPRHTTRVNELVKRHWRRGWRLGVADKQMVAIACKIARVPPAECRRRVSLHVVLAPRQRIDPDCFWKVLLDSLKACRAIKNDSLAWVELGGVSSERGASEGMIVTLEDAPDVKACSACKGRRFVDVPTGKIGQTMPTPCPRCLEVKP